MEEKEKQLAKMIADYSVDVQPQEVVLIDYETTAPISLVKALIHEIIQKGEKFKSEDANQFWAVQLSCIAAIRNTEDDNTCRKYVLNFLKATEQLNNTPYKVINLLALVKLKRLAGKLNLFNPATDAPDLIKLTANALYS